MWPNSRCAVLQHCIMPCPCNAELCCTVLCWFVQAVFRSIMATSAGRPELTARLAAGLLLVGPGGGLRGLGSMLERRVSQRFSKRSQPQVCAGCPEPSTRTGKTHAARASCRIMAKGQATQLQNFQCMCAAATPLRMVAADRCGCTQ